MSDAERFLLAFVLFVFVMVLPLVFYLYLHGERRWRLVLAIFAFWFLWNLVNAPIHEGAHWLVGRMVGLHAKDYQLIQHFWEGDFVRGYIAWEDAAPSRVRVSTCGAYVADGLFILLGFLLFRWRRYGALAGALILAFTYLRSVFDVAVNYSADAIFGGRGDFEFILRGYPPVVVHVAAWLLIIVGIGLAVQEIRPEAPASRPAVGR